MNSYRFVNHCFSLKDLLGDMRVYHFANPCNGLKILREKRLKISRLLNLNDPFEFYSLVMHDLEFLNNFNAGLRAVHDMAGLICFSADWRNPVQWAHYAYNHTGLCFGFDTPRQYLRKVKYVRDRVQHNGRLTEGDVEKLLLTKYEDWRYEKEYRVFVPLKTPDGADNLFYTDFHNNLKLKTVIIGVNSTLNFSDVSDLLGNPDGEIEVFKAGADYHKFEMTRTRNINQIVK